MKVRKLFLAAVIALSFGLTACSNDDEISSSGEGQEGGNTNVSVTLKMSQSTGLKSSKSLPSDYNYIGEWAGSDEIKNVSIFIVGKTTVSTGEYAVGDFTVTVNAANEVILTPKKAVKTTAGQKSIYALINGTTDVVTALSQTNASDFAAAYATIALKLANTGNANTSITSASKLIGTPTTPSENKEVIVMTNTKAVSLEVEEAVTEADALTGTKNRASIQVERAVARVMVTSEASSYDVNSTITINGVTTRTKVGTISNITWVLAQGENSLYVQRKDNWETPNFGFLPATDAEYINQAGDKYDYSGLYENYQAASAFGGTPVATMADYAAATDDNGKLEAITNDLKVKLSGKFILPTIHVAGTDLASTGYRKGNTAYVLIRAKFTPETFADGGVYTPNSDFYLGENGKFYTNINNTIDVSKGGVTGQKAYTYVGGKVLYYAWVNPSVIDPTSWWNSPVIRNNIYHINITGFKNIGTNWNPLFPEDPNNPKTPANGGNPDPKPQNDPEAPIKPSDPLPTKETWMSVDVKVLPWKLHSYEINLGI